VVEKATQEAADRLARKRADLGLVHFSDLEFVRTHWKRVFYEEIVDPDDPTGQARLLRPKVLTAKELRDLAASYKDIQLGQRLIFGENTYVVGLKSRRDELATDIPDEMVRKHGGCLGHCRRRPWRALRGRIG
jgi:hypothetical protein